MGNQKHFSFRLWVLFALVISNCIQGIVTQQERNIDPELQAKIDGFIENIYLPQAGASSLGLAIVNNDGELLYTTGYGLADKEKGIPVENSTQFLIGSASKSITALLAMRYLSRRFPLRGEAVLDTPIKELLPGSIFTLNDRFRTEHATFRDLLSHRLCLFNDDIQLRADPMASTQDIYYRIRYNVPVCGVRSRFEYSNQAYVILGELIRELAGTQTYEELALEFFAELGMDNTTFMQKSDDFPQMPYRAQPYYVRNGSEPHLYSQNLVKRFTMSNSAGGIFSTPNDMGKYLRFLLNKGRAEDGRQVVPANFIEWLVNPSILYPGLNYKRSQDEMILNQFGYGLGVTLGSYDGWKLLHHVGFIPPYTTELSFFPDKNLGIMIGTNESPLMVNQLVLIGFIFDTLRGKSNKVAEENAVKVKEQLERMKQKESEKLRRRSDAVLKRVLKDKSVKFLEQIEEGEYGSGSAGELNITRKFNEETNQTQYYMEYGRYYRGWLSEVPQSHPSQDPELPLFKIKWDTEAEQDNYLIGDYEGHDYVAFDNQGHLYILQPVLSSDQPALQVTKSFTLGMTLDRLPTIPWAPGSC